jgi:7-carboxy-7-deazaguanine synthase
MVTVLGLPHVATTTVPVSEVFGPVFQGEGPFTGRACYFLRLGLCNLRCSWCDTAWTWDTTRYDVHAECPPRTADELRAMLPDHGLVILSGGEPLIHQNSPALHDAIPRDVELHVETNGTLAPGPWALGRIEHFTVSPKVADQGDPEHRRLRRDALEAFVQLAHDRRAIFKCVVRDNREVRAVAQWMNSYGVPDHARWVMPEGISSQRILERARFIADTVAALGMNLTLRQHVLLYDNQRRR